MNLSFRQLNAFREVMRAGSISQAARTLGRTQPAVSSMIAGLEQELGFALFLREHSKLTATPEARYFLEECEEILTRLEQTKRTLRGISTLQTGQLRIACMPAASGFFIPAILTDFLADKPGIDVSLMMRSSKVIEDLIASQQFDIGIAETPGARSSIAQSDFTLECVCALPANHPLAAKPDVTPLDLNGQSLAMLFDGHITATQTRQAFERAGAHCRRQFELQTFLPGLRFVEAGLCAMICDMVTAHSYLQGQSSTAGIVFRPFRPAITNNLSLLRPAHAPPSGLAIALLDRISTEIGRLPQQVFETQ